MRGYVTIYKDQLEQSWILDLDGGTREQPGAHCEGFASWPRATAAATAAIDSWRMQYPAPQIRERARVDGRARAHEKAAAAKRARAVAA
jgi:hypothetical protein